MENPIEHTEEEFEHAGMSCEITDEMGHWCGYVQTPEDLPPVRWRSDYDSKQEEVLDPDVEVWGGVTYGPDDEGWVGFDDAHAESIVEHREFDTRRDAVKNETERLAEQVAELTEEADA